MKEKLKYIILIALPLFIVFCGEGEMNMEYSYGKDYDSIELLVEKIKSVDSDAQKQNIVDEYLKNH